MVAASTRSPFQTSQMYIRSLLPPSFSYSSRLTVDLLRFSTAFQRTRNSLAVSKECPKAPASVFGLARSRYNPFRKTGFRSPKATRRATSTSKPQSRWKSTDGVNNNYGDNNSTNFNGDFLTTTTSAVSSIPAPTSDKPVLTQVVTYNILSPSLASPKRYTNYDPNDLLDEIRLPRVLHKLEECVSQRAIICLQEVSMKWAGSIHQFFANRGYHLVYAPYGGKHNGYMGVGIAVPMDLFHVVDVAMETISDTVSWPVKRTQGFLKAAENIKTRLRKTWEALTGMRKSDRDDPWGYSRGRKNVLVFTRLVSRSNGGVLCVGTYHMPCAFWSLPIMLIHSTLAVSKFQDLSRGDDAVLAGDFNIKPGDACYDMITAGTISDDKTIEIPDAADGTNGNKWLPTLVRPMKSAYAEKLGEEPNFTNYAQVGDTEPFVDTLDYLFCSARCDVVNVIPLPHRDEVRGPFPSKSEPSDHVLVGATFRIYPPAPINQYGATVFGSTEDKAKSQK